MERDVAGLQVSYQQRNIGVGGLGCGVPAETKRDGHWMCLAELEHFALVAYAVRVYWGYFRVHDVDVCIVD